MRQTGLKKNHTYKYTEERPTQKLVDRKCENETENGKANRKWKENERERETKQEEEKKNVRDKLEE